MKRQICTLAILALLFMDLAQAQSIRQGGTKKDKVASANLQPAAAATGMGSGTPGRLSKWQVTGARSDAVMRKHTFKAEENKPARERGTYLSPEAFNQPEEGGLEWARRPELMRQMKESRLQKMEETKQKAQRQDR